VAAGCGDRLGLPDGKRVVLYAPTWRDNQYYASGRYRFDFRLDLERAWQELGDDHVILIRGHHHMADDVPRGSGPGSRSTSPRIRTSPSCSWSATSWSPTTRR
jgi:CDP-glycerol glycerophosphotransferase